MFTVKSAKSFGTIVVTRGRMHRGRILRRVVVVVILSGLSGANGACTRSDDLVAPTSLDFAGIELTVSPNPLVESGVGACVGPFGPTPPGTFRIFPYMVTVEETRGVGLTIESYRISGFVGGQEIPLLNLAASGVAERFIGCGGVSNRLEARQRRCTPVSPFCVPPILAVPDRLRVQLTGIDDNGFPITGDRTVNLTN